MTDLTKATPRVYLGCVTPIDILMPLAASAKIFAGMPLEFAAGYVAPVSGGGVFAGWALHDADNTGGSADGAVTVMVRCDCAIELEITSETPAQSHVGVAATFVEATDTNVFRIETGTSVTGTKVGNIMYLCEGSTTRVAVRSTAQHVQPA